MIDGEDEESDGELNALGEEGAPITQTYGPFGPQTPDIPTPAAPALSPAAAEAPIGGASMWNGLVPFDTTPVFDPSSAGLFWDSMPDEPEDASDAALSKWRDAMGVPDPVYNSDDED